MKSKHWICMLIYNTTIPCPCLPHFVPIGSIVIQASLFHTILECIIRKDVGLRYHAFLNPMEFKKMHAIGKPLGFFPGLNQYHRKVCMDYNTIE